MMAHVLRSLPPSGEMRVICQAWPALALDTVHVQEWISREKISLVLCDFQLN